MACELLIDASPPWRGRVRARPALALVVLGTLTPSLSPRRGGERMETEVLTVESIDLYYGAAQALRRVSVTAEPGKVTCVLGRNGVGKSSLLRAIVGHQPVRAGT